MCPAPVGAALPTALFVLNFDFGAPRHSFGLRPFDRAGPYAAGRQRDDGVQTGGTMMAAN